MNSWEDGDRYSLQDTLDTNITTIDELSRYIPLSSQEKRVLKSIVQHHPLSLTRYYLSLINPEDPEDPLRKIVIPSFDERSMHGSMDTSGERENTKAVGLQHKYGQTALILATHRCAAYCRYCFRKRLVGLSEKEILRNIDQARDYVMAHPEITNVLISGGDPLSLETHIIEHYLRTFCAIPHLRYLRIGSRIPVVLPERIYGDKELLGLIETYSTPERRVHIVTHFNHPREVTPSAVRAINELLLRGAPLHNQAVLLKGVNDDPDILAELFLRLTGCGVLPYYLFQCRPVQRVTHFQVSLIRGIDIVNEVNRRLDGISKRYRYVMSHWSGKIEIISYDAEYIYFKYHQARDPCNIGIVFKKRYTDAMAWLAMEKKKVKGDVAKS